MARFPWLGPALGHVLIVLWVFAGPVFEGRVPYFRDVSTYYYPNYVFLESAFAQGLWPLWHPFADSGSKFLMVDPMDLGLVWLGGANWALRLGPALHTFIAMMGASALARFLGQGSWGSWMAGAAFGLSGFYLSTLNLLELNHGTSWAPWVVLAFQRVLAEPTARRAACLGILAAIQVSTLAAEVMVQTAVLGLALVSRRPGARVVKPLALAAGITLLLAAPALLGMRSLLEGTERERGFSAEAALGWSAKPAVLFDMWVPGFFGDPHTFTDRGFWGQSFFPDGYPYLLSLYTGFATLALALHAGRARRLWAVAILGVLLSLGAHGPLAPVVAEVMRSFRTPVKFMFLPAIAIALLAGLGLHKAQRGEGRVSWIALTPGLALLSLGLALLVDPQTPARLLGGVLPALTHPLAIDVATRAWPLSFVVSGLCAAVAVVIVKKGPRLAPLAGLIVAFDLLLVGEGVNPSAEASFYELEPPVQALVHSVPPGSHRWFSYGFANTPGLRPANAVLERNRDVWLYYFDRQSLLPRTHVIDGLEGAFDEDRVGWSPPLSTLTKDERTPAGYARIHRLLMFSGVRYVLSLVPIHDARLSQRGAAPIRGLNDPLRLYELVDTLPRAFFVPDHKVVPATIVRGLIESASVDPRRLVLLDQEPPQRGAPTSETPGVDYERTDPHTVIVRANSPAGLLVVLDGFDRSWQAESEGQPVPLLRANGRHLAIPTEGGERVFTLRYRPRWRGLALSALAFGLALSAASFFAGRKGLQRVGMGTTQTTVR